MTIDNAAETTTGTASRARASRRSVLGSIATAGALAGLPTGAFGLQDDAAGDLEAVAEFEPPALPENLAVDEQGTVYLSMGPSGEIRAVDSEGNQSSVATLETGDQGLLLGITVLDGALYAANGSGQQETHGIWRVDPEDGESERIASLSPDEPMPNGIVPDPTTSDALLVSDHLGGAIWRVTTDGEATPWVSDSSLEPDMDAQTPVGADGLAAHPDGDVYVGNLNAGSVMRVPVADDGSAGQVEQVVQDEGLVGADGMTIDEDGSLYVAVNAANEVIRVTDDQKIETFTSGDPLDFPADVHFGTTKETATSLYIANFAYGTFLEDEAAADPSLARVDIGTAGYFPETVGETSDTAGEDGADDDRTGDDANETADDG
ncbi:SMP-30/gluconolactonase/LRE family protein [Natrinema sp. SYSU A 869]|uniref:SMP-30/gluconolactonase/LRE family protein n=1 Tax=Natrinema sp. SYSU A 869 TaxID=2871694 RepID=UPI001CA453D8|nr:SMP-30/gluconolactonase/LRE family protein [Natrinema sp. SYSU A 869]